MVEAARDGERLRLWNCADGPAGEDADGLTVEYAGRVGHPSSYGLLGGRRSTVASLHPLASGRYESSLAGDSDDVEFGLPNEYKPAVAAGLHRRVEIVIAAHGRVGSSESVFRRLAATLSDLLDSDDVPTEADLWASWDSSL
jgi:hypothetical protein